MKPILSPLKITDFVILNYNFSFEPILSTAIQIDELFNSYELDMDYAMDKQEDHFRVFVKASINDNAKHQMKGYKIFAECITFFKLEKGKNQSVQDFEMEEAGFIRHSAIPMAINCLRTYIITATGNAPLGKYILPSIDIQEFYNRKAMNDSPKKNKKAKSKVKN